MEATPHKIEELRLSQKRVINKIRVRETANVVFFISSLSMWQHQAIYELMVSNPCFNISIIYTPFNVYSYEDAVMGWEQCKSFFKEKNVCITNIADLNFKGRTFKEMFSPDILFYPQWYSEVYDEQIDIHSFYDCLICLIPYGVATNAISLCYNCEANFYAWRQYLVCDAHKEEFVLHSPNGGDNAKVVGYPKGDEYAMPIIHDPWKVQQTSKKRIIWAPHFTIEGANSFLHRSHFLQIANLMWELSQMYKDTIQFAFKPHPRLMTELYKHPDWGKEKTDVYYAMWATGENTQLETGEYSDLFKTSDAMIHDCGSFTAEYLYVEKPVFFVVEKPEDFKRQEQMSDMGSKAFDAHYTGIQERDIRGFIENVVIGGDDPKATERESFKKQFLVPPSHTMSASELIYEDICKDLWIPTSRNRIGPIAGQGLQPIISVIIPCYNQGCYLAETLRSVMRQTFTAWEVIIVNDGSKDNSEEIAKTFVAQDDRIHYYYQKNGGVSKARNNGIKHSKGKYILPLDSDDIIAPFYLEKAVRYLDSHSKCKVYYCHAEKFGDEISPVGSHYTDYKSMLLYHSLFSSIVYRKDDFYQINGYDETFLVGVEDWDFSIRLLANGGDVYQDSDVMFYYRYHNSEQNSRTIEADKHEQELLQLIYMKNSHIYDKFFPNCIQANRILLDYWPSKEALAYYENESKRKDLEIYKLTRIHEQWQEQEDRILANPILKILYKLIKRVIKR